MLRAAHELVLKFDKDKFVLAHKIASFHGAYQKKSNRGAGGLSSYCFGSVFSMSLGKLVLTVWHAIDILYALT